MDLDAILPTGKDNSGVDLDFDFLLLLIYREDTW